MKALRVLGLVLAPFLLSACGEETPPEAEVVRPVKILEIGGSGDGTRREYPGTIAAAQRAELAFEVQGKLTELPVAEGQEVSAGTVLARIDPRDYESRRDKTLAALNNARTEYERAKKLFEEGVTAEAEFDRRARQLEAAEADHRETVKGVEDAVLKAPFDGVVARKLVEDFENVQAKQPVLLLEDSSSLEIKVDVPERDLVEGGSTRDSNEVVTRRIQPEVVVTSLPDRSFPARVKELSTSADPATRTFRATLSFDSPDDVNVLPGMTAKVRVLVPDETGAGGLTLPVRAVAADEAGASYVWVVAPDAMTVSRRPVTVGELSGDRIAVLSGVGAGDWVAISGVHHLREGMQVSRAGD